jgi:hypothetical protein
MEGKKEEREGGREEGSKEGRKLVLPKAGEDPETWLPREPLQPRSPPSSSQVVVAVYHHESQQLHTDKWWGLTD